MRTAAQVAIIVFVLASPSVPIAQVAQTAQAVPLATLVSPEETTALTNGWALLAAGRVAEAAASAQSLLARYPRSIAAASLFIEAEIARGGGVAGLAAYENWLGARKLENGYLLRRAARAILWAATTDPAAGVEALKHLAADDDAEARAQLTLRMNAGGLVEAAALARLGDENAVRRLIDQIEKLPGSKMFQIKALAESKSPLAIPPLTNLLKDANHPEYVAEAAGGLGTLGATDVIPQLRRLYSDPSNPSFVRSFAAGALFAMNDTFGIALLQQQLSSEHAEVRLGAAKMMAGNPDAAWQSVVRTLTGDPEPTVRARAAELVAAYDLDLARGTLEALMTDPNPAVRDMAGKAMIQRTATDFGTLRRFLRVADALTRVAAAGRVLELTR